MTGDDRLALGALVADVRLGRHMSISAAAAAANVAINTYKRVEAGKPVQAPNLVAILLALGLTSERVHATAPSAPSFGAESDHYTVVPIEDTEAGQLDDQAWYEAVMDGVQRLPDVRALPNGEEAAKFLIEQWIEGARQRGNAGVVAMLRNVR